MNKLTTSSIWGVSIALSWTWGLGLFFSVQMALQFGLPGLLGFAIPNALGLMLFGLLVSKVSKKHETARDFESHFFRTSHAMRGVFLAYQFTAVALTFFAVFRYMFEPLGIALILAVTVMLGLSLLLGEQFDIQKIKWSHLAMFVLMVASMAGIAYGARQWLDKSQFVLDLWPGEQSDDRFLFVGFLVPIIVGLVVGPWLDLQQWQRAIQIYREGGSVRHAYVFGGLVFFCIIVFHGVLALVLRPVGGPSYISPSPDALFHGKDYIVRLMNDPTQGFGLPTRLWYLLFLSIAIASTLDSGYVAFKWYLKKLVGKSEHIIMTVLPPALLSSPVWPMVVCVAIAAVGVLTRLQLEYFMSFYAAFSVGYSVVFLFRTTYRPEFTNFTQTTLFSVAAFSLGVFGIGYFEKLWLLMAAGALIPAVHGFVVISSRVVVDDLQKALPKHDSTDAVPVESISGKAAGQAVQALEAAIARLDPKAAEKVHTVIQKIEPTAAQALAKILDAMQPLQAGVVGVPAPPSDELEHARGHFEGKWFTHTFMATYQDTNSVGNVYFAMYGMWVGKVREMFFRVCMPGFDLNNTPFFILTRSFEHKFIHETKEFEFVTVKIRVESFNRKFATLEHEVLDQTQRILGKGKQVLLFVSSKDYTIVDLPDQVKNAFLPHI